MTISQKGGRQTRVNTVGLMMGQSCAEDFEFRSQDRSHQHKAILSLNGAAWTISCARPETPPLKKQSLPKYALEALHNEHKIPDPLSG